MKLQNPDRLKVWQSGVINRRWNRGDDQHGLQRFKDCFSKGKRPQKVIDHELLTTSVVEGVYQSDDQI